jgi:hypothetical protein
MRYIHTGTNTLKTACLAAVAVIIVACNAAAAPAVVTIPGDHAFSENITSTSDSTLYVGSLARGGIMRVKPGASQAELFRVEMQNGVAGKVTKLQPSQPLVLTDGLRPVKGNVFLMIEGQGKLDRVTVDGDKASGDTIKDGFAGPTGVTLTGDAAWVSEGQLAYLFDPAKKELSPRLPFSIDRVPLSGN